MEEECPEMCDLEWRKGKKEFHYPRNENAISNTTDIKPTITFREEIGQK